MAVTDADRVAFALGLRVTVRASDGRPVTVWREGDDIHYKFNRFELEVRAKEIRRYARHLREIGVDPSMWSEMLDLLPPGEVPDGEDV